MNIDDLNYFLAIAETGLLHRAATHVGVSQPALTKAVRRLETELGVMLFDRSPKGMQLTRYGAEFQRHAVALRASYEDAISKIAELHSGDLAKVRVGATPATEPLVDRAFLSLLRKRPALRLDLTVHLSDSLMRALPEGDIDIAVSPLPENVPDGLRAIRLANETTSLVCRSDHPLTLLENEVTAKDLGHYPWILPGPNVSARRQIDSYFQQHRLEGPTVQVQSSYTSPIGVFYLVANTDMIGICSTQHWPVAEQLGLKVLPATRARWPRQISCLVRDRGPLSPLTETFIQELVAESKRGSTLSGQPR
ncbi:LysR family transcriptional regulator [Paraburkholderia sp. SG-MS1]|uniref:LysR family transcriptional regulator n=1 Tax=Paraburkholderia sp. SG-MS1 TaxID=2023741 RepID=UPI0014470420|nr:LysR family transcriptional regulator [Paraburkholderia sp. SG-MS1]